MRYLMFMMLFAIGSLVMYDLCRRYLAPAEVVVGNIVDKSSHGVLSRKVYFLQIEEGGSIHQYETTSSIWEQAVIGQHVRLTVSRKYFVRNSEPTTDYSALD